MSPAASWWELLLASATQAPPAVRLCLGTALVALTLHVLVLRRGGGGGARVDRVEGGRAAEGSAPPPQPPQSNAAHPPRRLSLSTPGLLFNSAAAGVAVAPGAPPELAPGGKAALRALLAPGQQRDLFLITLLQPVAGVTEAQQAEALTAALVAEGLLGSGAGQLPPHRSLVCSTHVGRVALVRQLATELHVEACAETVAELSRFGVRLQHLSAAAEPGSQGALSTWLFRTWPALDDSAKET